MVQPFDDTTRRNIAARCAAFARLPESEPAPALKRAAVAIALVEAGDRAGRHGAAVDPARRGPARPSRSMGAAGRPLRRGRDAGRGGAARARRRTRPCARRRQCAGPARRLSRRAPAISLHRSWYGRARARRYRPTPRRSPPCIASRLGDIERADAFDFTAIPESTRRVIRFRHAGRFIHAPTAA